MLTSTSQIQTLAASLEERLVAIRRELHQQPEVGLEEVWTTERIRQELTQAGIAILPLPLKTGLVAEVRGAKPGPVVAIRADIDALPVHEETGLSFASTIAGRMHACGHDFHTSTALGAALILQQMADELAGTVRFLFQPAEEIGKGAILMIEAGALDGVSAIFGLHNKPDLPAGHIGLKVGPLMAAVDLLTIRVRGKGGHAAIPDACIDPVVAGSAIVMGLQTAVSRSISPLDSAVVSIGAFQAGTAHNVISPMATLLGTVRTFNPAVRSHIATVIKRIAQDVAVAYGATAEVELGSSSEAVDNDPAMVELVRQSAERLAIPVAEAVPSTGGEDFAQYQLVVPGCFFWLGTGCAENWHHPKFMVDESVMTKGAALFAQVAVEALGALRV